MSHIRQERSKREERSVARTHDEGEEPHQSAADNHHGCQTEASVVGCSDQRAHEAGFDEAGSEEFTADNQGDHAYQNPGDSSGRGVPNYELRYEKDLPYCEIIVSAKGCGAELPNVAKILTPATLGKNYKGLKQLVLDTICGSNGFMGARGYPCPPFSIGIGLGGQMDVAAKLSREAISTRNWLDHNPDPLFDELEQELLADINKLQNGPAGIGGDTTALAVKIGWAATHTAICPVVINFHCWVARRFGIRFYPDGRTEQLFQAGE